jgi:hypothetical protein
MRMPFRHIVVIVLAGGLIAGCGDERDRDVGTSSKAEEEQVRAVAEGFTSAALRGDYERACSLTTSEAKAALASARATVGSKGGGCAAVLEAIFDQYDDAAKAQLRRYEVTSVQVTGDTAVYTDSTGDRSHARKQGGKWLIDSDPPER